MQTIKTRLGKDENFYTLPEVSEQVGLTVHSLRDRIRRGKLFGHKIGKNLHLSARSMAKLLEERKRGLNAQE